ncbi:MAG: hypothetical protein IH597_10185 [Bacteroidales bacterium]|nr:hypothetical protein [Bacteroidales bacterium]
MAKGYYIVSEIPKGTKKDLVINLASSEPEVIPIEQQELIVAIAETLEVITALYESDDDSFHLCFDRIKNLASLGLVGDNAQPQQAFVYLEQFRNEITNKEGGHVKNKYLKELGRLALIYGLPPFVVGMLFYSLVYLNNHFDCLNLLISPNSLIANLLILWSGVMVGVWLSFAITKTYIEFKDLTIIEKDRLEPSLRLIFTGILGIIFSLLFITKIIVINIGSLSSSMIEDQPIPAFVLGVLLGLNEKILGSTIKKKSKEMFTKDT